MHSLVKKGTSMKPIGVTNREFSLPPSTKRIRRALGIVGIAALLILINGCAGLAPSREAEQSQYNPTTGYPAVGDRGFEF
jgi:hypothetical protein